MKKAAISTIILLGILMVVFVSRSNNSSPKLSGAPEPITTFIDENKDNADANPPFGVSRCEYKNQIFWTRGGGYPDSTNSMFDSSGTYVCAPGGGVTGQGLKDCNEEKSQIVKTCQTVWRSDTGFTE